MSKVDPKADELLNKEMLIDHIFSQIYFQCCEKQWSFIRIVLTRKVQIFKKMYLENISESPFRSQHKWPRGIFILPLLGLQKH